LDALVREIQQIGGIADAEPPFVAASAEELNRLFGTSGGEARGRIRLLTQCLIFRDHVRDGLRQIDVVDQLRRVRVIDERPERLTNATLGLVNRAALSVTADTSRTEATQRPVSSRS
jgi:hypothetical protein